MSTQDQEDLFFQGGVTNIPERDWTKPLLLQIVDEPAIEDIPLTQRRFHGETVKTMKDHVRLNNQLARIWTLMIDGRYRTVQEISEATGEPETSVSAQLRNLRKRGHGSHGTPKQKRDGTNLWEYRLVPNPEGIRPVPIDPKAFEKGLRRQAEKDGVKGQHDRRTA